jgi:hypothetical protein
MNELIKRYDKYSEEEEKLLIIASVMEDQLKAAGAVGGKDYSILDCFKLAMEQTKANSINKLAEYINDLSGSLDMISLSIDTLNK